MTKKKKKTYLIFLSSGSCSLRHWLRIDWQSSVDALIWDKGNLWHENGFEESDFWQQRNGTRSETSDSLVDWKTQSSRATEDSHSVFSYLLCLCCPCLVRLVHCVLCLLCITLFWCSYVFKLQFQCWLVVVIHYILYLFLQVQNIKSDFCSIFFFSLSYRRKRALKVSRGPNSFFSFTAWLALHSPSLLLDFGFPYCASGHE